MYTNNFSDYWNRVVFRRIDGKLWLIDPRRSYNEDEAIILAGSDGALKLTKESIPEKVKATIFSEYERISLAEPNKPAQETKPASSHAYPWKVGIELTGKCNFRCVHCYASPLYKNPDPPYQDVISLLDNLCESGVLFVWFTGGECTIRPDFVDIYKHAKQLGLVVSIVTNGSLSKDVVDIFKEYPPKMIKVSQYGASELEYKNVTGSAENYNRFAAGVKMLSDAKLNFAVQTVLLKENLSSLNEMKEFCAELECKQNVNPVIASRLNGDSSPIDHEVDRQKLSEYTFSEDKMQKMRAAFYKEENYRRGLVNNGEYFCNVGLSECFVSSDFRVNFCVMIRNQYIIYKHDQPFHNQFLELSKLRSTALALDSECRNCNYLMSCYTCPYYKEAYKKAGTLTQKCGDTKLRHKLIFNELG